jgi:uncharacterized protein
MTRYLDRNNRTSLQAGRFSTWLRNIRISVAEGRGIAVPCGDCNVCCRSSQFIHVAPSETRTLNRVPKELFFPAPFLAKGYMVLGYDEHGRCPMLKKDKCSIYRNRPATCRSFDCRILPASGVNVVEKDYNLIVKQAQRWQFSYSNDHDYILQSAVQTAAAFLTEHRDSFPTKWVPRNSIQLAFLSIMVYDAFLEKKRPKRYESEIVKKVLNIYKRIENQKRSKKFFFI